MTTPVLPAALRSGEAARWQDYISLLKPRVMSLVIFTALTGMVCAGTSMHPVLAAVAILCIAAGAGGSAALNMAYDADIDALMRRTKRRAVPAGRVQAADALALGIVLSLFSVGIMGLAVNGLAAGLLAFTIFFYAVVYTLWLKRRTPQNIVIGGLAGALPPAVGWAAVTGDLGWGAIALFAIIFFWTPPHFWALSLYKADEYAAAGVPMLPVVAGPRETKKQMLLYTLVLWPVTAAPWLLGVSGLLYAVGAGALSLLFTMSAIRVWRDESERSARQMFVFSLAYLFLIFVLLLADHAVGAWR